MDSERQDETRTQGEPPSKTVMCAMRRREWLLQQQQESCA